MPAGQSHTTWFPELKATLKSQWQFDSNIEDHFALINKLNNQLTKHKKRTKCKSTNVLLLSL